MDTSGKAKDVRRLNIMFADEDAESWKRRRAAAMERRELAKQQIRLQVSSGRACARACALR